MSGKSKSICSSSPLPFPKNSRSGLGGRLTSPEHDGVAAAAGHERAQVAQDLVGVELVPGLELVGLDQEGHGVDPEAVDAELEPEAGDLGDLGPDGGVADVEVGLVRVEVVEVPLPGPLVVVPDAVLGVGEDDVGLRFCGGGSSAHT